jgi:hypothetical protein
VRTRKLVFAAISSIARRQDNAAEAILERIEEEGDLGDVLQALDEVGELLRRSGSSEIANLVRKHTAVLAPDELSKRVAFEELVRALLIEHGESQFVSAALTDSEISDTDRGDIVLGAIVVAGRTAEDLGMDFRSSQLAPALTRTAVHTPPARPPASAAALSPPSVSTGYRPSRRSRPHMTIFTIIGLVLIPWTIYANQDAQRLQCLGYKVTGQSRPVQWTVTCFLNGNL